MCCIPSGFSFTSEVHRNSRIGFSSCQGLPGWLDSSAKPHKAFRVQGSRSVSRDLHLLESHRSRMGLDIVAVPEFCIIRLRGHRAGCEEHDVGQKGPLEPNHSVSITTTIISAASDLRKMLGESAGRSTSKATNV